VGKTCYIGSRRELKEENGLSTTHR
jgi:hypothetical protein